jgi:hypothetical protein
VLQALSQLALELRQQIWSIGNLVCFAVSNFQEAYELGQQIFSYDPQIIKMGAKSETGQPIVEPDRGQYLQIANEIQRLKHRECIMRRFQSEKILDKYVLWARQTKEVPQTQRQVSVFELKENLLKERGIDVSIALQSINQRKITVEPLAPPSIPVP